MKRSRACLPIASDCWVEPSQTPGPREAHAILSCTKLHSLLDVQSGLLGKFQVLHLIHHQKNEPYQYDDYNGKCFAHIRHISMIFGASPGPKIIQFCWLQKHRGTIPDATTNLTQRLLRVSEQQTALVALFHDEAMRTSDETTSLQLLNGPNSMKVK